MDKKLWYIYTMEYYSAIKKNTLEFVLMRWMKLGPIIQSEASQKEKHQYNIVKQLSSNLKQILRNQLPFPDQQVKRTVQKQLTALLKGCVKLYYY